MPRKQSKFICLYAHNASEMAEIILKSHPRKSYFYRVSQEEYARLREGVPYVKVYRYNLNTYVQS